MDGTAWCKLLGWLILTIPIVSAYECSSSLCSEIDSSDLSLAEKDYLKLNTLYTSNYFPDHSFVRDWNLGIDVATAPSTDYQFAKDVWFKMFTIMPSIMDNGSLFVPTNIEILSGYGHRVEVPTNYYSSYYPETNDGDCQREYSLTNNDAIVNVYVGGDYQGTGKLVSAKVNTDSSVKAAFNLNVGVDVKHYRWDKWCCRKDNRGYCRKYCYDCEYEWTEHRADNIVLSESIAVKHYSELPSSSLTMVGENVARLDSNGSVKLSVGTSSFTDYNYFFDVNYTPNYLLTLNVKDANEEIQDRLYKAGDNLIIKNNGNCQIETWNYFFTNISLCDTSFNPIDLEVKTDKLSYNIGEVIKVNVEPSDLMLNVSYGDESQLVNGYAEFAAKRLTNKVSVSYKHQGKSKIVYIKEHDNFARAWYLAVFVLFNLFLYRILKHYFGGQHG